MGKEINNDEKLKLLGNKHQDKIIFIVGGGPSLHFQNIDLLKEHIVIGVNSGILKVPWANYFLGDDWAISRWSYYVKNLKKMKCQKLLYKAKLEKHSSHLNEEEIVFFNHKCFYDPSKREKNYDGLIMTKDPLEPIIGARTATGTAAHWAYIMGGGGEKNPIVFLGIDCCFKDNKRYFWQYNGEPKPYKTDNNPMIWHADKGKKDGYAIDYHSVEFLQYWEDFKKIVCDKQNINIINCSGGILNSFSRMTLEELLKIYD